MSVQYTMKWAVTGIVGLSLLACGGDHAGSDGGSTGADTLDTVVEHKETNLMKVGGHLFSIPSPVQSALLFRRLGLGYQKELPMALDKADQLATKGGRALALGLYGADLAYVTIQKDGAKAIGTLGVIEKLSGQLEMSHAFDKALMDRFKRNMAVEDSLLVLTGAAFRAADEYLKVNDRSDVAALVLAGGWIESLYLTINVTSSKNDQAIANRIGEQKRTLDDLIQLVQESDTEGASAMLVAELKKLQAAYAGVTATYVYEKPVTDPKSKTTHINSTSTITITPEQIKAIGDQVNRMRASILA